MISYPASRSVVVLFVLLWCLLTQVSDSSAADRVALVVGNGAYTKARDLKNPIRDAAAVSTALRGSGFQVIEVNDATVDAFFEGLESFKKAAAGAEVALFFYAGHGLEVEGKNYLLPVDASLDSSAQLRTQTVPLETVLGDLDAARATAKLVILDCCRNNPLTRSWMASRSSSAGGLGELGDGAVPPATMIMYASAPGQVALDGTGTNSPFTEALVKHLTQPGLSAFDAFLGVSDAVAQTTGEKQVPWIKFDGAGRAFRLFTLGGGAVAASIPASTSPVEAMRPPVTSLGPKAEQEVETDPSKDAFWQQPVMLQLVVLATGSTPLNRDGLAKFIGTNGFVEGPPGKTLTTMLRMGPENKGILPLLIFKGEQLVAYTVDWDYPTKTLTELGLKVKDRGVFLVDPESETGQTVYREFFGLIAKKKE